MCVYFLCHQKCFLYSDFENAKLNSDNLIKSFCRSAVLFKVIGCGFEFFLRFKLTNFKSVEVSKHFSVACSTVFESR